MSSNALYAREQLLAAFVALSNSKCALAEDHTRRACDALERLATEERAAMVNAERFRRATEHVLATKAPP